MSDLKMFSRDFGSDYTPAWRAHQAFEYLRVYREAQQRGEDNALVIPPEEDDEYIVDFFSLLVHGSCHYPEIKYAHSCFYINTAKGMGTVIQSMLLGGKTIRDIADKFKTSEKNINCYLKMFFDVERYLDCETLIYSLISPYDKWTEYSKDILEGYTWMAISYAFGWETAKAMLQRRLCAGDDIVKKFTDSMSEAIKMQASEYALGTRVSSEARPSDFERHINLTNATSLAEQGKLAEGSIANGEFFRQALWGGIKEVSSSLDYDDPVRKIIGDKERKISLKDKEPVKLIKFSTPQPL